MRISDWSSDVCSSDLLISRLNDSLGLTSIIVTHHVHETLPVADRAIVIANGKIVFSGTPAELEATSDPLVLPFLRGEPEGPIQFATAQRGRGERGRGAFHSC